MCSINHNLLNAFSLLQSIDCIQEGLFNYKCKKINGKKCCKENRDDTWKKFKKQFRKKRRGNNVGKKTILRCMKIFLKTNRNVKVMYAWL